MNFDAFDTKKMDAYAAQAKASWGKTPAYKEFEEKSKGRKKEEDQKIYQGMIDIFEEFRADPERGSGIWGSPGTGKETAELYFGAHVHLYKRDIKWSR